MLTAEPKAYGSNWHAATRVEDPNRGRLTVELDVDVCVIGAGLAGLTVANEVARLGWSVVVLEAQSVAWSASGRNAGVVLPGYAVSADALIERVGLEQAKALWARSEAGAEYVRNAARNMPGVDLSEGGWLQVSKTDDTRAMAHEAALLAGEFGASVEPWTADRVREALHSPRYFHGLHYPRGFNLHPLNYALGLAAAAEAAGARIFEDTPVLEIDPAGVRKRVVTSHSRVRAAHVVLAGNAHLTDLVPQFAETLLPVFTTVLVSAPLGGELQDAVRFPGAVSDSRQPGHHHRVVDGHRLIWSGRSSVRLGKPQRQANAMLRQIRRTYPALRGIKSEYAWTGVAGHTVHGMPQIGEITPGLWLLGGFGGHGLNTTAMGGEMLARAIVEGDTDWTMFSPFALVWAGGRFGRAAKRLFGWSRSSREMIDGVRARHRDAGRRRAGTAKIAAVVSPPVAPAAPPASVAPAARPTPPPSVVEPVAPEFPALAVAPVAEPVVLPVALAMEPAPAAIVEEPASEVTEGLTEGQSGGAAPPIPGVTDALPEPVMPKPAEPAMSKQKRGPKKKKAGGPPTTLKDLSQQMVEDDPAPTESVSSPDKKI